MATFKQITGSTDTVHTFNEVFPLTDRLTLPPFTEHFNQLRVFKKDVADVVTELFPVGRPSPDGTTDFVIDTAGTQITLDVALIATDTLVIMRETLISRSFAILTGASRFRGRDRNVIGDQILFIVQEIRELRLIADILGSGPGDPFEYDPKILDPSPWTQTHTGDNVETDFSYSDIEMFPPTTVEHDGQLVVFLDGVIQVSGFTVNESATTVDFDTAPGTGVDIVIRRMTRIDKRWVTFRDGSTFSSLQDVWDFLNINFIVEETVGFPVFLLPNALSNRIFPRALNILNFSGPGDRFFFGNLAWFGDGTVFVFKNDLLLVQDVDYKIDFIFFTITLTNALVTEDALEIITTTPNNAFNQLGYSLPGGRKNPPPTSPPAEPIDPPVGITDPDDISNLIFWGDATDVTENPPGLVEIMTNQKLTPFSDLDQSVQSRRPTIVTILGKTGLQFDGSVFKHLDGGVGVLSAGFGTLVMVLRLPTESGTRVMWFGRGDVVVINTVPALWKETDGTIKAGDGLLGGIAVSISPDVDWAFGDDVMLTLTWDGVAKTMVIRVNSIQKDSGIGANFTTMNGVAIGAQGNGGNATSIIVYGLVVYNSILSGQDLADIEEFMTDTYLPV